MRASKFLPIALLLLSAASPASAGVSVHYVDRLFEGDETRAVIHGELIDQRLHYADDPVLTRDEVAGDRLVITLHTRQEPGLRQIFSHPIVVPPSRDWDHPILLVVEGIDLDTFFRTEYYSNDTHPEQPVAVTVDKTRLLSTETFRIRSVFQAVGGAFAGRRQDGNLIRQQLDIGCYYCAIPFPVFDFDLESEPFGPLPAGEYTLEVVDRLVEPYSVIHREKITVLPDPLLLQQGRFEVEVLLDPPHGGRAQLVGLPSRDSALFYFFSPDNWESMVKVLDGCAINGHFWVFAAASTDVGFRIAIEDLETGTSKEYHHEAGTPAPAITDISAFPCGASWGEAR